MSNSVVVVINHKPTPKERPSYNFKTRTVYTPKNTLSYESYVKHCGKLAMKGKKKFTLATPLRIKVTFVFAIPKSWNKSKKEQAKNGEIFPTGANIGDTDNLLKSLLDGLNKVVWEDDRSIVEIEARKKYGDENQTIALIEVID